MSSYPVPRPARDLITQWAAVDDPAVIFDFNGTLSDDEPILFQIFGELFGEHLDWAMTADDYDRHLLGHSDREIVEKAMQISGIHAPVDPLLELRKRRYRELVAHHNPITAETAALEPGDKRRIRLVKPGILVAGWNPVSTDAVAAAAVGFDPMAGRGQAPFEGCDSMLKVAEEAGIGTRDLARIEIVGAALRDVKFPFRG